MNNGAQTVSIASDYWSLGTIIFEILSSKKLYDHLDVTIEEESKSMLLNQCLTEMNESLITDRILELFSIPDGIGTLVSMMLTPVQKKRLQVSLSLLSEVCLHPNTSLVMLGTADNLEITRILDHLFWNECQLGENTFAAHLTTDESTTVDMNGEKYSGYHLVWRDSNATALRERVHARFFGRGTILPLENGRKVLFCTSFLLDREDIGMQPLKIPPADFKDYTKPLLDGTPTLEPPTPRIPPLIPDIDVGINWTEVELIRVRIIPSSGPVQILLIQKGGKGTIKSSFFPNYTYENAKLLDIHFNGDRLIGYGREYVQYNGERLYGQALEENSCTVYFDGEPAQILLEPM
ncbi:hypothetical protein N9A87_03465 [Euryarchaeota archaeon]|nr:hypothetical protein [Euryarchaeota archaeon]